MLRVTEDRRVVPGFGCSYEVTTRTWLLFGLPVWRVVRTARG